MAVLWLCLLVLAAGNRYKYIACYKPALTLCSLKQDAERAERKNRPVRQTLADLQLPKGLHIVGRLDRDSEGLLLLTDDGQFTTQTLSEDCHKCYWALVQGVPSEEVMHTMRKGGLTIRGAITRPPISVRLIEKKELERRSLPPAALGKDRVGTWVEVVLNEGRNRQVRKITADAGHRTIRLCRVAIGALELNSDLKPGKWMCIEREQVNSQSADEVQLID